MREEKGAQEGGWREREIQQERERVGERGGVKMTGGPRERCCVSIYF